MLQAIPSSVISVFLILKTLCDELTSMVRSFCGQIGRRSEAFAGRGTMSYVGVSGKEDWVFVIWKL